MKISSIIEEVTEIAEKYNLTFVEIDRTDNIVSLKFVNDRKSIGNFVQESMRFLEEKKML